MSRICAVACLLLAVAPLPGRAQECCVLIGEAVAGRYRVSAIEQRRFTHADLWKALAPFDGVAGVRVTETGRSVRGRGIRAVTFGTGPTRVVLWSQMHGDESTATIALADLIRFFAEGEDEPLRATIRDPLTVTMVPMLDPDGAERFQRYDVAADVLVRGGMVVLRLPR